MNLNCYNMDEKNPLHFVPPRTDTKSNRSGRPTNSNLIKFSPQPRSRISEMLIKMKQEKQTQIITDLTYDVQDQAARFEEDNNTDENMESVSIKEHIQDINETTEAITNAKKNKNVFHSCDYSNCSYTTKLSSNLIKHKRTHTMEKPYLCDQCSFRSNFVNSLKAHKRIHTNERPYCCNFCTYRCNSSSNLKKHCKHRHWNID